MGWIGAVRCGAVRCGAVRCGAVRCGAVRCGVWIWLLAGGADLQVVRNRLGHGSIATTSNSVILEQMA